MKNIVQKLVRFRNPIFQFDTELNNIALIHFFWVQCWDMLRGCKVLFLGRKPKGMLRGKGVSFFNMPNIQWGKFLRLGNQVHISGLGKSIVRFGNDVAIGDFSRIVISTSLNNIGKGITIGNNVGIGEFAYLGGAGGLEIGHECIVGQYFSCHPENHIHADLSTSIRHQGVSRKGIKIGNNCWIGSKVTILDGVELGQGCIVAAGSVVNKSFPKYSIIGGVPAKLLKTRQHEA